MDRLSKMSRDLRRAKSPVSSVLPALLAVLVWPACPVAKAAQPAEVKLTASDAATGDLFGFAVAIDTLTAVVGTPSDDEGAVGAGSAYVFVRQGKDWVEQAKLVAGDPELADFFGFHVAVSGNTVVVGAPSDRGVADVNGKAYVFRRSGSSWSQEARLVAPDGAPDDEFGNWVSVAGDTLAVGAPGHDQPGQPDQGAAYVFVRVNGAWSLQQKLLASDGNGGAAFGDEFGYSVSISGETLLVGARFDSDLAPTAGAAYVFERAGGVWIERAKLTAGDPDPVDRFGRALALEGSTAVISARLDDEAGANAGAAYVFVGSGSTWTQQTKLLAGDAEPNDVFGHSVSLNGARIVVSAHLDDDACAADPGCDSGAAYVFKRTGTAWSQESKLVPGDGAAADFFGFSVAIAGSRVVVGSPLDDDAGESSGSTYVLTP